MPHQVKFDKRLDIWNGRPASFEVSLDELDQFLARVSCLREAGYGVLLPGQAEEAESKRLNCRLRSCSDRTGSSGLFSPTRLLDFDWELALDGEPAATLAATSSPTGSWPWTEILLRKKSFRRWLT